MRAIKQRLTVAVTLSALGVFGFACSDDNSPSGPGGGGGPATSLTWDGFAAAIYQNTATCNKGGCHGSGSASSGFSVASYNSVLAGGNNGAGIVPNDTANSIAYQKLLPTPPFGGRMPLTGPPYLPQSTLDSLAAWIMAGAPQSP